MKRKDRKRKRAKKFEKTLKSASEEGKRFQEMQERAFATHFLSRVANFPPGMLLAATVLRPDGGLHNVVVATDELRRLSAFAMPQLGMGMSIATQGEWYSANRKLDP